MSNGEVCCILGICCPPAQRKANIAKALVHDSVCSEEYAATVADWFDERFDFAPKGTLDPLVEKVAHMARKHPAEGV